MIDQENNDNINHGLKTKFGMLLTKYLREISHEKISFSEDGSKEVIVTKAEALARTIWKLALGYTETIKTKGSDGKTKLIPKIHKPDPSCIDRIYERLEGKVANITDDKPNDKPLGKSVEEQAVKRINALVSGDSDVGSQ